MAKLLSGVALTTAGFAIGAVGAGAAFSRSRRRAAAGIGAPDWKQRAMKAADLPWNRVHPLLGLVVNSKNVETAVSFAQGVKEQRDAARAQAEAQKPAVPVADEDFIPTKPLDDAADDTKTAQPSTPDLPVAAQELLSSARRFGQDTLTRYQEDEEFRAQIAGFSNLARTALGSMRRPNGKAS